MATRAAARLSAAELRRFGLTVATGLGVLAMLALWRGRRVLPAVLLATAAVLALLAMVAPARLAAAHRAWMRLAEALGWFNTRVLLGLLFYLIVTPIGLIMRLAGRDPLDRRLGDRASYWVGRRRPARPPESMERQF